MNKFQTSPRRVDGLVIPLRRLHLRDALIPFLFAAAAPFWHRFTMKGVVRLNVARTVPEKMVMTSYSPPG